MMNTGAIIILILWGLFAFIWIVGGLIVFWTPGNLPYTYVLNRKDYRLWKYLLNNADKFKFVSEYNGIKTYSWNGYGAIIWKDGLCSIHDENIGKICHLSTHCETLSKRFADSLIKLNEHADID